MTENDAITGINADKAQSVALATTVAADFASFDQADVELSTAVSAAATALASLESNVTYAIEKFL